MPYSNPRCPNCGKPTSFTINETYGPENGKRHPYPAFQRYGYWFADCELMCGYCRRENWLSRWSW